MRENPDWLLQYVHPSLYQVHLYNIPDHSEEENLNFYKCCKTNHVILIISSAQHCLLKVLCEFDLVLSTVPYVFLSIKACLDYRYMYRNMFRTLFDLPAGYFFSCSKLDRK